MKEQKIVAMLLSLLIAAMACTPIVSAEEVEPLRTFGLGEKQVSPTIIVLQNDGNVTAQIGQKKGSLKPIPISELKEIKIPAYISAFPANLTKPANYVLIPLDHT